MTEALTPAEALRAMADNLDRGRPAMAGLQARLLHGQYDWRDVFYTNGDGVTIAKIVEGRLLIRRKPALTEAQKAGWSVGDVGRVKRDGRLVMLLEDDGSRELLWKHIDDAGHFGVGHLDDVERLIPESQITGSDHDHV